MAAGTNAVAAPTGAAVRSGGPRLITIVLADEAEYLRFTAAAFAEFDGAGLELTDVAVPFSLRVRPWLLKWAATRFALRVLR